MFVRFYESLLCLGHEPIAGEKLDTPNAVREASLSHAYAKYKLYIDRLASQTTLE
jgi:hypothetical protein